MDKMIIKNGGNYKIIAGNAVSLLPALPAGIYELAFDKNDGGFSLNEAGANFALTSKLYGDAEKIKEKVLSTFEMMDRNLGVLISGPKGLGKSLTIRNICNAAIEKGLPVILIKENFGNIVSFINTVYQNCVVVFDDFEKVYDSRKKADNDDLEGQESMISIFDSALGPIKMFLLSCNEASDLADFLMNRPGRIHYHFKMSRLSIEAITEYCKDNLIPELAGLIPSICALGMRLPDFSYDMLRSVLFELNAYKCPLSDIEETLNISNPDKSLFNFKVFFASGSVVEGFEYINLAYIVFQLHWRSVKGDERDSAYMNLTKLKWTGLNDGSMTLTEDIVWENRGNIDDRIEKIIFTPERKYIHAEGSSWKSLAENSRWKTL
jgi:hypothetical protein